MDPEGMVHALEIIHDLLGNQGSLVNIQPVGKPRPLEIHTGGRSRQAGLIGHRLNFAMHKAALEAVAQVVRDGLFVVDHEETIPFLYRAPSFPAFQEWLAETSENSILAEETAHRARALWQKAGADCEVIMQEELYMGLLRPG
jgi:hypothetical protein